MTAPTSTVTGVVVERWLGRVVTDATVVLNGFIATTDATGSFAFTNIPAQRYTLKVLHRDYEPFETIIDVSIGGVFNITTIQLTPIFKIVRS